MIGRRHPSLIENLIGLIGVAGLTPGCGVICTTLTCCDNPCDDGLFCNGSELCLAIGGPELNECLPGLPIMCEDGLICDEELDACVPDPQQQEEPTNETDEPEDCPPECLVDDALCLEEPIEEVGTFDARLPQRLTSIENCGHPNCFLVSGMCANGPAFLYSLESFETQVEYFDSRTGSFVGLVTVSDLFELPCFGITYWPEVIECADAVVTNVHYGDAHADGDPIELPTPGVASVQGELLLARLCSMCGGEVDSKDQ